MNDFKTVAYTDLRVTEQYLIPLLNAGDKASAYNIYPTFKTEKPVYSGFGSLADWIISAKKDIIIDGYGGVFWDIFADHLNEQLLNKGVKTNWIDINSALYSEEVIGQLIEPFLGGQDPLFGRLYTGDLYDFFDPEKLDSLKPEKDRLSIVYGCGAAFCGWDAPIIYLEVPKNEIQFRSRAQKIVNIGSKAPEEAKSQYKRFYFIDWPVLNKHKKKLLSQIDIIADEQRVDEISWMRGDSLRSVLEEMTLSVIRPRPWFEPGVWGGQWLKNNVSGLNKHAPNYAWSFELIAPENGIIIEHKQIMLEISFDLLLFYNNQAILGKAAKRFNDHFPIRFDFLDTMEGGNLSLQCHPSLAFAKAQFGEEFTQDETYYILAAEPGATVYLGFQDDIIPGQFKADLEKSARFNTPVDVEKYVQKFESKRHDLFLIPNGTIHAAGKNNMVLEISATPYIFTFKMYDWLRPDLNGNPRPLNIGRAFENLNFDRRGKVVNETLISSSATLAKGDDWEIKSLSTHPDHFYSIRRFDFDSEIKVATLGQCHVLNLVEGDQIIVTTGRREQVIYFAETFIIPAGVLSYTLKNAGSCTARVICAYVKDEECYV